MTLAHLISRGPKAEAPADPPCLSGRTFLYVGGRLLSHHGGVEESLRLLPGLAGQSDPVLFPVACVSHEAAAWVEPSALALSARRSSPCPDR